MPWSVAAAVGAAAVGSAVSSAMAPSTGSSSAGAAYQPYNQPGMDTNFNNYYGTYGNILDQYYSTTSPMASSLLNNQYNNPYASNYQQGAGSAQGAYYGLGSNAFSMGATDYTLGGQLADASASWGQNGSMLTQLQQQAGDTANAQSYLRGIQSSPYGAAVATNAVDQTTLAYQQQQAATQANLAGAATSAYGAGTQQLGIGAQAYQTGSSIPYTAASNIYGGQNTALQNYYGNSTGNYLQGYNQLQSNALGYLGYGGTQQNTAATQAYNTAQMQSANAAGITNGLSSAIGGINGGQGIGGYFGSSTPNYGFSTGSSAYSNPSTYDYYGAGNFGGYIT